MEEKRLFEIADTNTLNFEFLPGSNIIQAFFQVNGCDWSAQASIDAKGFYAFRCEEPERFFDTLKDK